MIKHRFSTATMIEDTASSTEVLCAGKMSNYVMDRKVIGARKGAADYLAAKFRWSKGAVQLFVVYFSSSAWPWLLLGYLLVPILVLLNFLCSIDVYDATFTMSELILNWWYPAYAVWVALTIFLAATNLRFVRRLVLLENMTYFSVRLPHFSGYIYQIICASRAARRSTSTMRA